MSMLRRSFTGLTQFAHFLDERVVAMVPIGKLVIGASAKILKRSIQKEYGDHVLPDLAQATQDDRVARGYSPNDPLLRDGSLLRASIESEVGEDFAAVGTSEPIAAYQEFGFVNARTGRPVPPRPAHKIGLEEAIPGIVRMVEANVGAQLGFSVVSEAEQFLPGMEPDIAVRSNALEP